MKKPLAVAKGCASIGRGRRIDALGNDDDGVNAHAMAHAAHLLRHADEFIPTMPPPGKGFTLGQAVQPLMAIGHRSALNVEQLLT